MPGMEAILRSAQRMNVMIIDLVDAARFEGENCYWRKSRLTWRPIWQIC